MNMRNFIKMGEYLPVMPVRHKFEKAPKYDLFGGGSQPSGNTTSTQQSQPWEGVQPYLTKLFSGAQGAYDSGQLGAVAPQSQATQQYLQQLIARGQAGSPLTTAAQNQNLNMINGQYLDPSTNPAWAPMSKAITDAYGRGTAAQTDSAFNQAGAFGGSAYREQTQANQKALGDTLSNAAGNLYNTERGYQNQAIANAPALANADYTNINAIGTAGTAMDQYAQQKAAQPYTSLQQLMQLISGQGGGSSSTTSPYFTNPAASALGLGIGANALYGMGSNSGLWGGLGGAASGLFGGGTAAGLGASSLAAFGPAAAAGGAGSIGDLAYLALL